MNDRREAVGMPGPKSATTAWPARPTSCRRRLLSGVQPSPGRAGWPPEDHHHGGQLLSQRKPLPGAAAAEILQHARDRVHRRDGAGDPGAGPGARRVHDLAGALGVETRLENAMDPFFDPNSTRAVTQKMFPTKREMVCGDDLAISSSNFTAISSASASTSAAWTARPPTRPASAWAWALDTRCWRSTAAISERAIARLEALEDELASASEADAALA